MHILILGGTRFLGRCLAEIALERGHALTLFNRGHSDPDLFPAAEKLIGDRDSKLGALAGRHWDAVIDTCGYVPRIVQQSAALLANTVNHYTFISSLSVYADASSPGIDETAPVGILEDESVEVIDEKTYGPLKALCEQTVAAALPGRTLIIRPGLIVGSYDRSDRFTYWPYRIAQGGEVLAPGRPGRPVQFIDVRDLATWTLDMIEARQTGIYNANGPVKPVPMGELLTTCQDVVRGDATLTWVSDAFLVEHNVGPWMEMPLWIPESDPDATGFFAFDCSKAVVAGLKYRPIAETIRDTLAWANTRSADYAWRAGMKREREAELLTLWRQL
ncbi:MAG: epimerase [Anaerolineae bacterium]|nr:epimerase [Anaerolineae bacterium]